MEFSAAALKRTEREWSEIGGEFVRVEQVKGALYGFGSELATLRILKRYRGIKGASHGFSANLDTFYFCLETA